MRRTANIADVDECNNLEKYPCSVKGTCKNIRDGFECICPPHYPKGNAYNGTCEKDQSIPLKVTIPIGTAFIFAPFIYICETITETNLSPWCHRHITKQ
jgi:hypothetical protein